MLNISLIENNIKTVSTDIIQLCQPGFDISKMDGLIDTLFVNASALAKERMPNLDENDLRMISDKLVVNSLLNQLYFLDTSEVQVSCLHQIVQKNSAIRNAFEFIQTQNNYIPVADRSEEDEKIQRFVNAILA
jgi:hypothetical protein